jgi:hypothetical protein
MKKILATLLILGSMTSFAADRVKAKNMSDLLATYQNPSQSVTPDRVFAFLSDRDDVDAYSLVATPAMTVTVGATTVTFTRGETLSLTNCSADLGTTVVTTTTITVNTNKAPVRVLCSDSTGKNRVFYTTYKSF